jgi:hypothetical protein
MNDTTLQNDFKIESYLRQYMLLLLNDLEWIGCKACLFYVFERNFSANDYLGPEIGKMQLM